MACLGLMCGWIHRYIQQPSQDATQSDILHHGSYYAVCQAVFYVFAFRNKDIYDMKKGECRVLKVKIRFKRSMYFICG